LDLGWTIANGGTGTKEEAEEREDGGGRGRGRRRGEQMKGSEYEMNKFLFDYHLIFAFLSIANSETCEY
jgi:hypothetical protein